MRHAVDVSTGQQAIDLVRAPLVTAQHVARRAALPRAWHRHRNLPQARQQPPGVRAVAPIPTSTDPRIPLRPHQRFQLRLQEQFQTRPDRPAEHRLQILLHVLLRNQRHTANVPHEEAPFPIAGLHNDRGFGLQLLPRSFLSFSHPVQRPEPQSSEQKSFFSFYTNLGTLPTNSRSGMRF